VGEIEFDFLDKTRPLNYTSRLASKMQHFAEDVTLPHLIKHMYVVEEFDKERI
jgi:secreted Zn-dependent insulinase-like peptidase